jgi:hypothetical protein
MEIVVTGKDSSLPLIPSTSPPNSIVEVVARKSLSFFDSFLSLWV